MKDLHEFAYKNGIKKIILFGSRARNEHYKKSDIDIAVSGGDFDSFYWDVHEHVHSLLMFDIIDLNSEIPAELKNEISKDGILIYEKI